MRRLKGKEEDKIFPDPKPVPLIALCLESHRYNEERRLESHDRAGQNDKCSTYLGLNIRGEVLPKKHRIETGQGSD